jgi:multiple sugar transport system substrate-binding protein
MKRILTLSALTVATALCSSALAQQPTLRILSISSEQQALYKEVEVAFNKKYPQWTIRFETLSQDAFTRTLPLSFQSGDAPDMILNRFAEAPAQLLANGWIEPLSDKPISNAWKNRFPKYSFVDGYNVFGGKIHGVSLTDQNVWGPGYFYYNRVAMKKAGLTDKDVPKTWNQLLAACEKLQKAGVNCFSASLAARDNINRWWIPFTAVAQSNNPFNFRTGEFGFDNPDRLRAWTLLKTLFDKKYFIPGVETTDRETSRQIFGLNQAAFYVDGAWMPNVWQNSMGFKTLDFGVAPVPVPDRGTRGKLVINLPSPNLYVTTKVRNKDAAWAVVDFMTDPSGVFAKGFVGGGYGFVSFAPNKKLLPDDQASADILSIASKGMRKYEPAPVLACTDMAKSSAFREALRDTSLPEETVSVVEALVKGQDWTVTAKRLSEGRQKLLEDKIKAEQAKGLKVSMDYFKYPEYRFGTSYDYRKYPLCK